MARPRLHDDGFLRFLRQKPCCCGCGRPAPSEAAHIRLGFFAMGKKPDDSKAVPLNAWCHRLAPDSQHQGEEEFWERRSVDPFKIAERLYREYGGDGGQPKKRRKRKTIVPKGFHPKKIISRPFPRAKRKIQNRGFK